MSEGEAKKPDVLDLSSWVLWGLATHTLSESAGDLASEMEDKRRCRGF